MNSLIFLNSIMRLKVSLKSDYNFFQKVDMEMTLRRRLGQKISTGCPGSAVLSQG